MGGARLRGRRDRRPSALSGVRGGGRPDVRRRVVTFEPEGGPVETGGPEDRLLPWDRVRDVTGLSRSTAWRLQQVGDFPEPVRISPNRVGWWESELTAWKATRKTRGLPCPRPLVRPREPKLIQTARSPRRQPEKPTAAPAAVVPEAPSPVAPAAPPRRKRQVSADQIDFGF
ncbi:MAG: AlpA family phage regulatory protein [Alphaproteobacteria bacterium]|nr:AlpA family phage regulatory protein [Alphaproteobacteria bacterium]MBU3973632.1 AlpA family phage regulatory protein [Alphaproteobacteria bacterium]MBU4040841.1 AlpA family phage regulatory protein [Alphaproteobacteria bacterium]MBU4135397.1 AlpA family phage regulatory protein [Alphaproteobacteria bacterium]